MDAHDGFLYSQFYFIKMGFKGSELYRYVIMMSSPRSYNNRNEKTNVSTMFANFGLEFIIARLASKLMERKCTQY